MLLVYSCSRWGRRWEGNVSFGRSVSLNNCRLRREPRIDLTTKRFRCSTTISPGIPSEDLIVWFFYFGHDVGDDNGEIMKVFHSSHYCTSSFVLASWQRLVMVSMLKLAMVHDSFAWFDPLWQIVLTSLSSVLQETTHGCYIGGCSFPYSTLHFKTSLMSTYVHRRNES
jgi:hypothetical protein